MRFISSMLAQYGKLVPVFLAGLLWIFFSGFREIKARKKRRRWRELLLCLSCIGFLFAALFWGSYALLDPANGLAKGSAPPVSPEVLDRFAFLGGTALGLAFLSGLALEYDLRKVSKA